MSYVLIAFFVVLNPLIAMLLAGERVRSDYKRFAATYLCTAVPAGILMLAAFLLKRTDWTAYEFMCVNAVASAVIAQLAIPTVRNKNLSHEEVLKALCFSAVLIAMYSILTFGQTQIHSDTATATLLNKSQIANRSLFPKTWNYANGDIWVLTINVFTFPFVALMENQSLARMLGSAVYVLAAVVALAYHSKAGFRDKSWILAIPLSILFLTPIQGDMILYQAAYTSGLAWITLCGLFAYKVHSSPNKKRYYVLLAFSLMILCMAGIRGLAEQIVPLLCGYVAFIYADIRKNEQVEWGRKIKEFLRVGATILIPAGVGFAIYLWLSSRLNVNHTVNSETVFVDSLQTCWNNLVTAFLSFFECFGYNGGVSLASITGIRNMVSIIMCVIVVFVCPVLQAKKLDKEDDYIKFFFWYGIMHNLVMLIMAVLLGKTETRYLMTSVFVFIIMSARYIYVYWISQVNFRKALWTGLFVVATIVYCIPLARASDGWYENLAYKKQISQQLLERGMTKGYATYWNAYTNEVYSDLLIRFGAIDIVSGKHLQPFSWLVDGQVYEPEDTDTFLLLSEEQNQQLEKNRAFLLSKAREHFTVNEMHAYIFNFDVATEFSNGIQDGVVDTHEMYYTGQVELTGNGLVVKSSGVVFGPYTFIDAGEYTITFVGSDLSSCITDVCSESKGDKIEYEKLSASDTECVLRLTVSEPVSDIEFRVFGQSDENPACLNRVRVEKNQ